MADFSNVHPTCETALPEKAKDAVVSSRPSRISYTSGKVKGLVCGDSEVDLEAVVPAEKPSAGFGGEYIKSFVFGGLDGIVSTFALVAGLGGAQVNVGTLIAVSLAKVLADGFSMGFGEFTSAKAEMEHTQQIRKKQMAIIDKNRDGEVKELASFYVEKGMEQSDALTIVSLLAQCQELFLEHVMAFQHGVLGEEEEDKWQPLKQGFVCFLAFVVFGMVPLFGFIVFYAVDGGKSDDYWVILAIAYGLTVLTLFIMGITKAKLTGSNAALKSGMLMVFNGTFAGGMAFLLGEALAGALSNIS
jgi:VIT1/CCC1 family predicted Fe2+/Mn2+ transporter